MKISIIAKNGFASWVEAGLGFIGSGEYGREGNEFRLNVSPHHVELLVQCVEGWANTYVQEYKKLNPGMKKYPNAKSLWKIKSC